MKTTKWETGQGDIIQGYFEDYEISDWLERLSNATTEEERVYILREVGDVAVQRHGPNFQWGWDN